MCMYVYIYIYIYTYRERDLGSKASEASAPRVGFDAVAPQVLRFLSALRGANARAGEAFALRETASLGHTNLSWDDPDS